MSHLDANSSNPPTVVNSTRSSFTYLEPSVSPINEKAEPENYAPTSPSPLEELTSRGEEEIERYGGDEPRDPPTKVESVAVPALPAADPNMVQWDGPDDPENPQNWSTSYKWLLTMVCIIMTVNVCVVFLDSISCV